VNPNSEQAALFKLDGEVVRLVPRLIRSTALFSRGRFRAVRSSSGTSEKLINALPCSSVFRGQQFPFHPTGSLLVVLFGLCRPPYGGFVCCSPRGVVDTRVFFFFSPWILTDFLFSPDRFFPDTSYFPDFSAFLFPVVRTFFFFPAVSSDFFFFSLGIALGPFFFLLWGQVHSFSFPPPVLFTFGFYSLHTGHPACVESQYSRSFFPVTTREFAGVSVVLSSVSPISYFQVTGLVVFLVMTLLTVSFAPNFEVSPTVAVLLFAGLVIFSRARFFSDQAGFSSFQSEKARNCSRVPPLWADSLSFPRQ